MRRWARPALVAMLLGLGGCESGESTPPDFLTLAGDASGVADHAGKWLFINYWAEWCKPCLEEIPELNTFHATHTGRMAEVFGVNYDRLPPEQLAALSARLDIRFPVLQQEPARLLAGQRPEVMPTTYVIDPAGRLQGALLGPQSAETLRAVMATGREGN